MLLNIYLIVICIVSVYSNGDENVHTWWHNNSECNDNSPVKDENVRCSTNYNIQIRRMDNESTVYQSFVYMSIPRGGRLKWEYVDSDGAEFANSSSLTMSWTAFEYLTDIWIEIQLRNISKRIDSIDHVTIRPNYLTFKKKLIDNRTIGILVPYQSIGYRFSVEFEDDLFTTYYLNGHPTENPLGRSIHREPRNSLLIFAQPMLIGNDIDKYIPNPLNYSIYFVPQGEINNLNTINSEVIYFNPGLYYMPWNSHALLSSNVQWIYVSGGAYVKGAFQFQSSNESLKVTGFGVISGEKYVYEADVNNSYHHTNRNECWSTCVKMLHFDSSQEIEQHLDLYGITISEPPYNSFVVYGDENTFHMSVQFYQQIGSWYWQTDGLEIYQQSFLLNAFFHSNDDVFKIYHSNVILTNITVWKSENGPVLQWGWAPRNIENITVNHIDIIHNRIWWTDIKHNTCLINSATFYADTESTHTADPKLFIKHLYISNIRSEGMNPCAIRIYSLSSFQSITIENLWIEQWNQLDIHSQISLFKAFTDKYGNPVYIGNQSIHKRGLAILNYTVGSIKISRINDNWQDIHLGRLGFDANLWNNWDVS